MLLLNEDEIRRAARMEDAVPEVEAAFAALARGEARLPDVIYMDFTESNGEVHVKGAHMAGAPYYVFKVASGFYDNPSRGLPVGAGLVMAFDATTGVPEALLLDNGFLTDLRTGAAGAVAAKHLARDHLSKVAMVGAGLEARFQLRALGVVRDVPPVHVWSRSEERATAFAEEMRAELGLDVTVASDLEGAVREADLVVTATPAREPIVREDWLSPGVHVTALGSDGPDKQELDVEVFRRADVVVCDVVEQCLRKGELHHAVDAGVLTLDDIAGELGDVVLGRVLGRTDPDQITVCDLTGVGVQDAAGAGLALDGARRLGLGTEIAT
jgi:ectoine utilization protein EutC